ncbi:MAG: lycopene cyclase, partial [Myxococcota bacterium]
MNAPAKTPAKVSKNPWERARDRVREVGGDELCERLEHLDAMRVELGASRDAEIAPADDDATTDYDVAMIGGGLSLLLAPLLAARGLRVAVFDRARIGAAHREWNGSTAEVKALSDSGVFSPEELASLVVAQYDYGVCRWHEGGSYPVHRVLDMAVDAGGLLRIARERSETRGVHLYDGHTLSGMAAGRNHVALRFRSTDGGTQQVTAKVAVDARGASSPYASADLVCPTVGGVLRGLREGDDNRAMNPRVGDILATTEHVEEQRQHIWEAFPGRRGETTVYLFYYDLSDRVGPGSLMKLYARFFERLPVYKDGDAQMIRPTFGYIPGWSRLVPAPRPLSPRVVLVGDAAARHSPLTFCGFGNTVRGLGVTADRIVRAMDGAVLEPEDAPIHAGTGALARMMATPPSAPGREHELNALLDAAFSVLHGMGDEAYGALLRDEMFPGEFIRFLHKTSLKRPQVYREVFTTFGIGKVGRWGANVLR